MTTVGTWLLIGALALVVVEVLLIVPMAVRLRRRLTVLRDLTAGSTAEIRAQLVTLQAGRAELTGRLRPYRRLWRILNHPLAVALLASYQRRRASR